MSDTLEFHCAAIQVHIDAIIDKLESQPLTPLKDAKPKRAAGAYLLFYRGRVGVYAIWALLGLPLYSGKTTDMADRLSKHAESINAAVNLNIDDFMVKYIELDDKHAHLACMFEAAMLKRYSPVWNEELTGFGLKDVGKSRSDSIVSLWDTYHPGRPKRGETPNEKTVGELHAMLVKAARALALAHNLPPRILSEEEGCAVDLLSESLPLF